MGDVDEEQSGENASLSQPSEQKSGLGEGEAASEVEGGCVAGNASKKPAVRYCYSIALLAGEGVKIEQLQVCADAIKLSLEFACVTRSDCGLCNHPGSTRKFKRRRFQNIDARRYPRRHRRG